MSNTYLHPPPNQPAIIITDDPNPINDAITYPTVKQPVQNQNAV